jgi:hypothetical protein
VENIPSLALQADIFSVPRAQFPASLLGLVVDGRERPYKLRFCTIDQYHGQEYHLLIASPEVRLEGAYLLPFGGIFARHAPWQFGGFHKHDSR